MIQSKIFPVYFKVLTYLSAVNLATLYFLPSSRSALLLPAATSLLLNLMNMIVITPAASLSIKQKELEGEEGRRGRRNFKVWHGLSALANLGCIGVTARIVCCGV